MKKKLLKYPMQRTVLSLALAMWLSPAGAWQPLSTTGLSGGTTPAVKALVFDTSGNLYAGGLFTTAGSTTVNNIAKWDGISWSALGSGTNAQINALAANGNIIYAGGLFTSAGGGSANLIAQWDGTSSWSTMDTGIYTGGASVNALQFKVSTLYVGGQFTKVGTAGTTANRIAAWNGTWSQTDVKGLKNIVNAVAVSGTTVFAGGGFLYTGDYSTAGYVTLNGIGALDSVAQTWSGLGTAPDVGVFASTVNALAVNGTDLYVGGAFANVDHTLTPANRIAKWNGSTWSALTDGSNNGLSANVNALAIDSTNNKLYAGGVFTNIGSTGSSAYGVAQWNIASSKWSSLGAGVSLTNGGLSPTINSLAVDKDGNVYAGGTFTTAGVYSDGITTVPASNVAVYTSTDLVANQWKLVSLPHYEAGGTLVTAAFDSLPATSYNVGGDPNGWIVWERDEATQSYVKKRSGGSLVQGKGYWVKSYAAGVMDMDGVETPVTPHSVNANCYSLNGCYIIELSSSDGTNPHYNLVGNPFINRAQWAHIRFEIGGTVGNPATGTTYYTPSGALSANLADKQFAVYNGSAYQTCDDVTGGCTAYIKPMQGFWVKLLPASHGQVVKLMIPKP